MTAHNGIPVIDERTDLRSVHPGESGYAARDYGANPFGSLGFAAPFSMPLIPRSEWKDRVQEMERTKSRISDMAALVGWRPAMQARTLFCWGNSAKMAVELARIVAGQTHVPLSAASVCCEVTKFANRGGWCGQAIEYGSQAGWVPESMWPANAIDRQYDTPATRAERSKYQAKDWQELEPRSFDQLMTLLLQRIPCCRADNRWSHAIACEDPLLLPDGRFAVLCPNSGLGRDANGYTIIAETFGGPDEAYGITVTT